MKLFRSAAIHDDLASVFHSFMLFFPIVPARSAQPTRRQSQFGVRCLSSGGAFYFVGRPWADKNEAPSSDGVIDSIGEVAAIRSCRASLAPAPDG